MKRGVKRILVIVAAVLVVLVAVPASLIASAFIGTSAIQDSVELGSSVRLVKDGFVTIGVVDVGGGKVALIDAGVDPQGKAILAELARRGLGPEAVQAVLLTHGHRDHTAGCHLFPAAPVYALAADVPLAEGLVGSHSPMGRMIGAKPSGLHVRSLSDAVTLTIGSRTIRVFAIPGHTPGSAAYLVDGVLFLGDSAGSSPDGKILPAPWAFSEDSSRRTERLSRPSPIASDRGRGDHRRSSQRTAASFAAWGPCSRFRVDRTSHDLPWRRREVPQRRAVSGIGPRGPMRRTSAGVGGIESPGDPESALDPERVIAVLEPLVTESRRERLREVIARRISAVAVVIDAPYDSAQRCCHRSLLRSVWRAGGPRRRAAQDAVCGGPDGRQKCGEMGGRDVPQGRRVPA